MVQLLRRLLAQIFGSNAELSAYQILKNADDYLVVQMTLRQPSLNVIAKFAGPRAIFAASFERTAMIHRLLRSQTHVPVSEIVAVDSSYRDWPWRYSIQTLITGQEWAAIRPQLSAQEQPDVYRQIGQAVAELHSLTFPNFGELADDGTVGAASNYLTALIKRAESAIRNPHLTEIFFNVLEARSALFVAAHQARLCHEDLHQYNLLFQQVQGRWQLAAILDFDKAWAGHHEIDLARLEFWDGMTQADFWQSYAAVLPIDPLYVQRRPIYQLLWCLEYAAPTPKHLADTQRLCHELNIPPVKDFD